MRTAQDIKADILNSYTSGTKWASDIEVLLDELIEVITVTRCCEKLKCSCTTPSKYITEDGVLICTICENDI